MEGERTIGVGRTNEGPPSLRTGRADLLHPALQSVVLPPRGLTGQSTGSRKPSRTSFTKCSSQLQPHKSRLCSLKAVALPNRLLAANWASSGERPAVVCSCCLPLDAQKGKLADRLAVTPPMGWNSWDSYGLIAVNQHSTGNRPLITTDNTVIWSAKPEDGRGHYLAIFNRGERAQNIALEWNEVGLESGKGIQVARSLGTQGSGACTIAQPRLAATCMRTIPS
jgi:hypothetical protein